ncbi:hypothetical protein [Salinimicrobium gaetbulicola]|uniref:Cell division protein FtsL n=1 Tax=Salinimicrobium gaetbulicola TaxID=999702 RepID=A0ABW3IG97_9FLAO
MKHPWKTAFWACFFMLIAVTCLGAYAVLDQGVTLTYLRDDHSVKERELEAITQMLEGAPIPKQQVLHALEKHLLYEIPDAEADTIRLANLTFVFQNDSLQRLIKNP